jgi:hypothetical protein
MQEGSGTSPLQMQRGNFMTNELRLNLKLNKLLASRQNL